MENNDHRLTYAEKLQLIKQIQFRQAKRWERLKQFHGFAHVNMVMRHFMMQREVDLIRSQKQRLEKLKQEIYG